MTRNGHPEGADWRDIRAVAEEDRAVGRDVTSPLAALELDLGLWTGPTG